MKTRKQVAKQSPAGPESVVTRTEQLLKAAEISARVIRESKSLSGGQKEIALGGLEQMRQLVAATPASKANGLVYIEQAIVQPWNEESGEDAEKFWQAAQEAGLDYARRDVLRNVLKRKRIKDRLEFEMVADTVDASEESGKISADEARELRKMVAAFERAR